MTPNQFQFQFQMYQEFPGSRIPIHSPHQNVQMMPNNQTQHPIYHPKPLPPPYPPQQYGALLFNNSALPQLPIPLEYRIPPFLPPAPQMIHYPPASFVLQPAHISKPKRRTNTPWTSSEDNLLRHLRQEKGLGWREISLHFPHRTLNGCQFRWRRIQHLKDNSVYILSACSNCDTNSTTSLSIDRQNAQQLDDSLT